MDSFNQQTPEQTIQANHLLTEYQRISRNRVNKKTLQNYREQINSNQFKNDTFKPKESYISN